MLEERSDGRLSKAPKEGREEGVVEEGKGERRKEESEGWKSIRVAQEGREKRKDAKDRQG